MVFALVVSHLAQAHGARHVLQFTVPVGAAGEAVEGVVGDIEFHHAAAKLRDFLALRPHHHAFAHGFGTGSVDAAAPFDLNQAQAAGSECFQAVRGAEFRHGNAGFDGGAHDGSARGHFDSRTVDGDGYPVLVRRGRRRGAVIQVIQSHTPTSLKGHRRCRFARRRGKPPPARCAPGSGSCLPSGTSSSVPSDRKARR